MALPVCFGLLFCWKVNLCYSLKSYAAYLPWLLWLLKNTIPAAWCCQNHFTMGMLYLERFQFFTAYRVLVFSHGLLFNTFVRPEYYECPIDVLLTGFLTWGVDLCISKVSTLVASLFNVITELCEYVQSLKYSFSNYDVFRFWIFTNYVTVTTPFISQIFTSLCFSFIENEMSRLWETKNMHENTQNELK